MSVSVELLLIAACHVLPTPEPAKAPTSAPVKAPVSAPALRWAPRAVQREQALIWVEPDVRRQTAGVLRRGQLVLAADSQPVEVAWRDGTDRLVRARAAGMEGWVLASDLREVDFPAWAGALGGANDPFENPSNLCGSKAAKPWAGGEFEILRVEGDQAIYEAGCMERPPEDAGDAEGSSLTPSKRKGSAPLLDFMLLREVKTCMQRLESTGNRSESLRQVWPQEPALCNVLKIEPIPLPGSQASWRIDLDGGDHPAEGFVVDGTFLPTPLSGAGERVFDGPGYTLWSLEVNGRLKVIRIGTAPPSALEVLDRPLTGEEVRIGGEDGNIMGGGMECTWLPGRKQFYICR